MILTKDELKTIIDIVEDTYQEYGCTIEEGQLIDKLRFEYDKI